MRLYSAVLGIASCMLPQAVVADHDSAQTILGVWSRYSARAIGFYELRPAKTVRALPVEAQRGLREDVAWRAKRYIENGTALALILTRNGRIVFEEYGNGATKDSKLRSYSMAKSLTSLALGEALCAGKVRGLDEKAATYATALGATAYGKSSIRNLLKMMSGAQDPGGKYSGIHDWLAFMRVIQLQDAKAPLFEKFGKRTEGKDGVRWVYNGLDAEAVGEVIEAATGMSLPRWFEQTVWQKAGAEASAGWLLDNDGHGFAELGFFATARDFARIGLYVLDRLSGKIGDGCIASYLQEATRSQVTKDWFALPGYGFFIHVDADGNAWFAGHGGQRIGINASGNNLLVALSFKHNVPAVHAIFDQWIASQ